MTAKTAASRSSAAQPLADADDPVPGDPEAGQPEPRWSEELASDLHSETADEVLAEVLAGRLPEAPQPIHAAAGALAGALRAHRDHQRARRGAGQRRQRRVNNGQFVVAHLSQAAIADEVTEVVDSATAALAGGDTVPPSFSDAVVLARLRAEYATDVADAHDELRRRASAGWTAAVHEHRDDLLAGVLRSQLGQVLAAAGHLSGQEDPRLARLAYRYDELRMLQEDLLGTALPLGDNHRPGDFRLEARVHEFADVQAQWPDWGWLILTEDATHAPPPWPRDPLQRLQYAAEHGAWMPTVPETVTAWEQAKAGWQNRQQEVKAERERLAAENIRANRIANGLPADHTGWRRRPTTAARPITAGTTAQGLP